MFYELKNGTLVETKDAQGNFYLIQVLGNKYLEDVDSEKCVIVDSDETDSNKSSEEVTFILTITYKCNMHCTYCYQQNDKTLEKKLISDETLDKILRTYLNGVSRKISFPSFQEVITSTSA